MWNNLCVGSWEITLRIVHKINKRKMYLNTEAAVFESSHGFAIHLKGRSLIDWLRWGIEGKLDAPGLFETNMSHLWAPLQRLDWKTLPTETHSWCLLIPKSKEELGNPIATIPHKRSWVGSRSQDGSKRTVLTLNLSVKNTGFCFAFFNKENKICNKAVRALLPQTPVLFPSNKLTRLNAPSRFNSLIMSQGEKASM